MKGSSCVPQMLCPGDECGWKGLQTPEEVTAWLLAASALPLPPCVTRKEGPGPRLALGVSLSVCHSRSWDLVFRVTEW